MKQRWANIFFKYKNAVDKMSKSGAGRTRFLYMDQMEESFAKDVRVLPVHVLDTRTVDSSAVDRDSAVIGATAPPSSIPISTSVSGGDESDSDCSRETSSTTTSGSAGMSRKRMKKSNISDAGDLVTTLRDSHDKLL